jgi:hypothetical protein
MGSERAVARIVRLIWALAAAGAIGFGVRRGWTGSAGWLVGAAISALNFRWLRKLTEALGSEDAKPRNAVFLGLRWVLIGAALYVIFKYSAISLLAALAGLFVAVVAVILEILNELAYARNGIVDH